MAFKMKGSTFYGSPMKRQGQPMSLASDQFKK